MSRTFANSPFLYSDDGKKIIGIQSPDGSFSETVQVERESAILLDTMAVRGSGLANGKVTDGGKTIQVTGGDATTIFNGSYIQSGTNAYIQVNAGQKVTKVTQLFSGTLGVIGMGADTLNLTTMLHVIFPSAGQPAATHYNPNAGTYPDTGIHAGALQPAWFHFIANCPNLNNGVPHELSVELSGAFLLVSVDKVLLYIAFHPDYQAVAGNQFFSQLYLGTGQKVYGWTAKQTSSAAPNGALQVGAINAQSANIASMAVGNPAGVDFLPSSKSYFYTDDNNGHVFHQPQISQVDIKATGTGFPAKLNLYPAWGNVWSLTMQSGYDAVGRMAFAGIDRITFKSNTVGHVNMPNLPTSATGLSSGDLWRNGTVVNIVA